MISDSVFAGLDNKVEELVSKGHRPSTARTYASVQHRYLRFCSTYGLSPLPATEHNILRFIAHLSHSITHASMLVYLSAVRALHIQYSLPPPSLTAPRIKLALKALSNLSPEVKQALPITFPIMQGFLAHLSSSLEDLSLWACMSSLFFGCRRAGELAPSRVQLAAGEPYPLVRDLVFLNAPKAILLYLARTKTTPHGLTVVLGCSGHKVCAYCAIIRYFHARGIVNTTNIVSPLFMINGSPMTKEYLIARQNVLLKVNGIDHRGYTPHSYRSGSATTLALNGVSEGIIQKTGAWRSLCYRRYIRHSVEAQAKVAQMHVSPFSF